MSHRWQPTRLLCPWDSPGKNTGVGCPFLLQSMKVKSMPGTSVFTSSETDISGTFWGHIKGVKYRFALQDGTWDFS